MDNKYYENVIEEVKPLFDEKGFSTNSDGSFSNGEKSFKIEYDESRQMYSLSVALISDDAEDKEYKEINAWLFDDSQNAKDASSVGIDFASSIRKELGIKAAKRSSNVSVDLPTAAKNGNINVASFTKKMLDIYPTMKDDYKNHIAIYGNFLYLNFFGEYLVPNLKNTFSTSTQKQIKKLYDVFADAYVKGDRDTVNVLVSVLSAAAYNDENVTKSIREMLSVDPHFLASFENFLVVLPKKKKIFTALVK